MDFRQSLYASQHQPRTHRGPPIFLCLERRWKVRTIMPGGGGAHLGCRGPTWSTWSTEFPGRISEFEVHLVYRASRTGGESVSEQKQARRGDAHCKWKAEANRPKAAGFLQLQASQGYEGYVLRFVGSRGEIGKTEYCYNAATCEPWCLVNCPLCGIY